LETGKLKGDLFAKHYLIATDHRIILWGRWMLRSSSDAFTYRHVRSVELQQGILLSSIVFNVGSTENFTEVQKGDARRIVKLIRQRMARER
jgi:hypothetical protein